MPVETEDLETNLNLAQRFQQIHFRKSVPRLRGVSMKGFKEFLLRGNVVDMLTPFIAAIVKKPDFSAIAFTLNSSQFMIGDFINQLISFMLVAAAVYFAVVIPVNKLISRLQPPAAPTTKQCPECLSEIPIDAKRCAHCTSPLAV